MIIVLMLNQVYFFIHRPINFYYRTYWLCFASTDLFYQIVWYIYFDLETKCFKILSFRLLLIFEAHKSTGRIHRTFEVKMEGGWEVQRTAITRGYVNARAKRTTSSATYVWRSTSTRGGNHGHSRGGGWYSKNNFNIKAENSFIYSCSFYKLCLKFLQWAYTCTNVHNIKNKNIFFLLKYVTLCSLCK